MRYNLFQPNPCPCRLPEGMPSSDAPTLRCAAPEFVPSSAAGASCAWLALVMLQAAVCRGPTHFMLLEGMPSNDAPALRSAAPDFVPSRAAGACCARSLVDVACSLASCFSWSHTLHLMRYKPLQPNPCPCRLPEGMPANDAADSEQAVPLNLKSLKQDQMLNPASCIPEPLKSKPEIGIPKRGMPTPKPGVGGVAGVIREKHPLGPRLH